MFLINPPRKIIHERSAVLDGKNFPYRLIQSPLARAIRLKMTMEKGLEIIVPRRFQVHHAEEIVAKHHDWILKNFNKLEARKKQRSGHQLHDGATLMVLGKPHTVKIIRTQRGKASVKRVQKLEFNEESASVSGFECHVYCDGTTKKTKEALEKYLRVIAEKYFIKRTGELAEQMGVSFRNITIRGQKTRWGSCTRDRNLNFNWRLILLPIGVAESVIIHELAHTVHMNHSRAFYAFIDRFCPEYRALHKQLRNPQFLL